jgi:hypothetical protein
MRHVELIRDRILRGQQSELQKLRVYVSALDEREAVDRLRECEVDLLAQITETVLQAMGHDTGSPQDGRFAKARRAARKMAGPGAA